MSTLGPTQSFLQRLIRVLSTYSGRDKAIRVICFSLTLLAQRMKDVKLAQRLMAIAKQLSHSRMVWRQLSHLPLIDSSRKQARRLGRLVTEADAYTIDQIDFILELMVSALYTINSFVETAAWLADAKILPAAIEAARWFRYCLYLWVSALSVGVARSLRRLLYSISLAFTQREPPRSTSLIKPLLMTLSALVLDLIAAANPLQVPSPLSLLFGNNRLTHSQASTCFLLASLINLYNMF